LASGEPSRLNCLLCETTYQRADGLRRHFLANHRLVWRAGEVVTADDAEIDGRLEALPRRQMSSRRRRRVRDEGRSVAEVHDESSSFRVAVIRGDSSTPADVDWDDADVFLASLPDLARPLQPPVEAVGPTGRTAVPAVCVEGKSQTDEVLLQSQRTMTSTQASRWPTGVDSRSVITLVRSRPDLSVDRLMEELRRQFPSISDADADAEHVKFAVFGIAWGLEEQARRVMRVVSAVADDPRSGPAAAATLLADLGEQAERRY
jgi:hypothetical protein